MALPGYFDDEYEDLTSNLAAVPVPPQGTPYFAADGTPLGRSKSCDPITMEPMLSGLFDDGLTPRAFVPEVLSDNRVEIGQEWALPLLAAVAAYHQGASPLQTALWSLGAYVAPLPTAGLLAYQMAGYGQMRPAFAGLGERRYRRGPLRKPPGGGAFSPIIWADPKAKKVRRCAEYRHVGGQLRCVRYKKVWPTGAFPKEGSWWDPSDRPDPRLLTPGPVRPRPGWRRR
jgi:hypothetical protein